MRKHKTFLIYRIAPYSFKSAKDDMHQPLTKPEFSAERQEVYKLGRNAFSPLSPEFRLMFLFRWIEQLSIEETCELTEIGTATVNNRYHHATTLFQRHTQKQLDMVELEADSLAGDQYDHVIHLVLNAISNWSNQQHLTADKVFFHYFDNSVINP